MAKKQKIAGSVSAAKKKPKRGGRKRFERANQSGTVAKDNVFETLWTRKKFDVLGKKQKKGQGKRIGQSRSSALEKRKNTLLQEYKQQGKGNVFVDRRFGERDDQLPEEDKAILRFQKERQSQINKKSKFTLPDEDDEELLTHGGMALSNRDDFNDNDSMQDDDDLADLDDEDVGRINFGGGFSPKDVEGADPERPKSRKEVMEDVVAKSKMYKAQKAQAKEEDEKLMEKLDTEFSDLVKSSASLSFRPTRKDRLKTLMAKGSSKARSNNGAEDSGSADEDKPDDFDKLIKDMTFDIRGHAGDRLKTAEENLKEERERLEELEKKRKKRMLGIADSDEESEGSEEEPGSRRERKRKRLQISGDDLGENFLLDDDEQEGKGWVDEVLARGGGEDEDGEEGSDEDDAIDEEDENQDDDEYDEEDADNGADSGDEWLEEEDLEPSRIKTVLKVPRDDHSDKKKTETGIKKAASKQHPEKAQNLNVLPFVINAPENLAEFQALLEGRPNEDLSAAIQRIRTCNAISLAAENRKKMQIFYNVLLQYFGSLAMRKPFSMAEVNLVTKPLIELSSEMPYFAAHCARQRLSHMHDQFTEKLKQPDGSTCWPSLRSLLQLRLWSLIFPPSDFRHPVMTPAILFMAECLMRCPVTSARDILVGSFLCTLLHSILKEARRYCPEVLAFILAILVSALPVDASKKARSLCPTFMVELAASNPWLKITDTDFATESFDLDFIALMLSNENAPIFNSGAFRCGILRSLLHTLKGCVSLYEDLASFPEAMAPLLQVLQTMDKVMELPEKLQGLRSEVAESIEVKLKDNERMRQPLRMRLKKPTPIKQFNPKFEENFVPGMNYDVDRERAMKKKLQRQVKREARGAARELRKDNYFLSEEKNKEKAAFEAERKEKYGKAMQFLQQQESAFKSGQLGKGKGRKRR